MPQFIGYHIDGYNTDKSIPVATGATYDEAMEKTMRRVLGACVLDGYMSVQQRDDVSTDDFAKLTQITEEFAAKHGLSE